MHFVNKYLDFPLIYNFVWSNILIINIIVFFFKILTGPSLLLREITHTSPTTIQYRFQLEVLQNP